MVISSNLEQLDKLIVFKLLDFIVTDVRALQSVTTKFSRIEEPFASVHIILCSEEQLEILIVFIFEKSMFETAVLFAIVSDPSAVGDLSVSCLALTVLKISSFVQVGIIEHVSIIELFKFTELKSVQSVIFIVPEFLRFDAFTLFTVDPFNTRETAEFEILISFKLSKVLSIVNVPE